MFRCIAILKNDATNSLGVISSKKALRSSLLHKLRKIPKAKIAFRCIPTCRGMGRQRIGNVRSIYLPADPTFIREKEVHGKRSSFAAKKRKMTTKEIRCAPLNLLEKWAIILTSGKGLGWFPGMMAKAG